MNERPIRTPDGSIVDSNGKVLYFSLKRFVENICVGNCCFICGISPHDTTFNNEHVLPNWLLKKFNMHANKITLPNGDQHQYGTYTVPCCEACNSLMAKYYETPISRLFAEGEDAVRDYLVRGGSQHLFTWMALIFLKLHLKDSGLRQYLDRRLGDETIAHDYQWELFHHLHAVARAFYVDASIDSSVFGSFSCMPALVGNKYESFDLADVSLGQTLMLRIDGIALFAVFDDASAGQTGINNVLENIKGPMVPVQLRELTARFAACNLHLNNRPVFGTCVAPGSPLQVRIHCHHDDVPEFVTEDKHLLGQILISTVGPWIRQIQHPTRLQEETSRLLAEGHLSLLFDDNGAFIQYPLQ
jgi:hypothetical protein